MSEWKPIATAPKDGSNLLVIDDLGEMMCAEFRTLPDGSSFWEIAKETSRDKVYSIIAGRPLTHWQPLPEPPK